jgi:DNA polymerase-4
MVESPTRKIIHVDMDAFFASVEQRDNSALRGRPVAVGHAAARGVVAAASYEARTFAVRSALPSVTAQRRCPDLVFVPPRFEVYREVSQQIHAVFARYTDLIQPLSLDEAYLDVTADKCGLATAWLTAKAIRAAIFEETGLTASAGISYNKFLAKLASDHRNPNGQFAVTPDIGADWVKTLPVSRFHGVGPVTAEKMKRLGIETGADLAAKSLDFLEHHFGSSAGWYYSIARGEDDRPVNPHRVRKSSLPPCSTLRSVIPTITPRTVPCSTRQMEVRTSPPNTTSCLFASTMGTRTSLHFIWEARPILTT